MAHSPLQSFDPFATHPFTNNSGLAPQPPLPSPYPVPIPSPHRQSSRSTGYPKYPDLSTSSSSTSSVSSTSSIYSSSSTQKTLTPHSPIPLRRDQQLSSSPKMASSPTRPIFVPFRQETSSPDLVLKNKSSPRKSDPSRRTR
ncbi:hypothetical protein B0H34DRAFT_693524 [Crassisporium funariophilum]|nr:hypothetical protein B0H34DRAFT_693524 [Crassisporium funariophilum]